MNCTAEGQVYDVKQKQYHVADSVQEYVTEKNSSSSIIGNSTQIAKIVSAPELINDYTTTPGSVDQGEGYENRETRTYNIRGKKVIHNHANHIQETGLPALVNASISKIKSLPLLPENFDCRLKADGFYSIGCKTEFVACVNHRMFFFECPHNLIFNEEKQSCDYKGNIKNCSKSLSKMTDIDEKESFSTINSEVESEISSEEKIGQIDDTIISEQDFCKKLSDGIYFNSCGNQYTVCSGEIAFIYNCPEGQIMDSASKTCNEPENILECMNKNDRI
ncbi:unnamed protein product [Onchocerca ochengi]|uniref:Chitin-binding type-2 domain-containing protein n=1 Tax=Onchocerca ochengi TaxID=42157 RepID=A0A182ERH1_ONCOC|nr:unnamed protein product [Onchocerca ochengi]VDM94424.1 unnamed protein product [Onchocerca ochengi]VDM94465.1 unnamed protein product [Onchocerca ochengi]